MRLLISGVLSLAVAVVVLEGEVVAVGGGMILALVATLQRARPARP